MSIQKVHSVHKHFWTPYDLALGWFAGPEDEVPFSGTDIFTTCTFLTLPPTCQLCSTWNGTTSGFILHSWGPSVVLTCTWCFTTYLVMKVDSNKLTRNAAGAEWMHINHLMYLPICWLVTPVPADCDSVVLQCRTCAHYHHFEGRVIDWYWTDHHN